MHLLTRTLLCLACLICLLPPLRGQAVEFAAAYPAAERNTARVELLFEEVPSGSGTVGLRFGAGEELQLGLRLRQADSLASIGNLVTVLAADGSTGGRYGVALTSRAVLGPVALRLRASVSDGFAPLAPVAEGAFAALPLLTPAPAEAAADSGAALLGLEAGVSYRISRDLIVDVAPGAFLRGGSLGGRLDGELRFVRAIAGNDLSLLLHAFRVPVTSELSGALGIGYTVNRRRAPAWFAAALLGWGPAGLAPGARLAGAERLANGRVDLELAAEPYRLDDWPYRVELGYRHDLVQGELRLSGRAGLEPASGWRAGARVGYRIPFTP
ncbi:MAG: hypothetical protein WD314_12090 [Trueperaceae bacterium]